MKNSQRQLDIKSLKKWARSNLPHDSTLKQILQMENDNIGVDEFLTKIDTWQKLYNIDFRRQPR